MLRLRLGVSAWVFFLSIFAMSASVALASTGGGSQPAGGGAMVRIPGHVLPALAQASVMRPGTSASVLSREANQPITLTLVLRRDDQTGFEHYLRDVYDPQSKIFRHFLTQGEIAARFGPSQQAYDDVLAYLRLHGFTLVEGSVNHLTLTVRGSRAMAERAFDVRISDYRIGKKTFRANDADPALPAGLAPRVQAIVGLSDVAKPNSVVNGVAFAFAVVSCEIVAATFGEITPGLFVPNANPQNFFRKCIVDHYFWYATGGPPPSNDPPPPAWITVDGTGQTVALIEFATFQNSDVADFLNLIGAPAAELGNVSEVKVGGGAALGPNEDEVLLDIDDVLADAPGAKVVVYDAPFGGPGVSFQGLFNAAINGGATVISNSWSYCEDQTSAADADSIDSILQNAAAAGISVFNGSGDSGNTCLDGSAGVIGVPADSPNATAVGGSSMTVNAGSTYNAETWWDGAASIPPTGQGGFGTSKFFARPAYQNGLNTNANRTIPDIVVNADPAHGVMICQADAGGCPTGQIYGGTSSAAPVWASFAAKLNQAVGHKIGAFNPVLYPLANKAAFHNAASMGSDFDHVGLGSASLDALFLSLTNQSAGMVSASVSEVESFLNTPTAAFSVTGVPDDGTSTDTIVVRLLDANGHAVIGKTVTLAANGGSSAVISPPSGVSSADNGAVIFTATDTSAENVTFTAKDTTDGITLTQNAVVTFQVPTAASGSVIASLGSVPADGTTADSITVTLEDSLNRPTPGKVVSLSQGSGNSAISAASPAVTNSSGQVQFAVTNLHTENVTYTATDITDGNQQIPQTATVDFTSGGGGCASSGLSRGGADPAPGYLVNTFASGFEVNSGNQGFSYNCFGAYGMAWDASQNMYVTDWPTGNIYKFGTSGGVADAGHLFATVKAPATGLAIDPAGKMFASEGSVSGANGDIVPVDLSTGTVGGAIASGFPCLGSMAIDPSIPALYVDDFCSVGPVRPNIWQVTGIDGGSPSTTVYAQTPDNFENFNLAVAPDGTVYDVFAAGAAGAPIARITKGSPPTVTLLTAADGSLISLSGGLGMTVGGKQSNGDAQFVIAPFNELANADSVVGQSVRTVDLTGAASAPAAQLTRDDFSGLSNFAIGPDGCLYVAGGPTVSKVTNADGTCSFGPAKQSALVLTPTSVSPNPVQGEPLTFTATFHYDAPPAGVPIFFQVGGTNSQVGMVNTDANGQALFTYTALKAGSDIVGATAVVGGSAMPSNLATVTWDAGKDSTFLTLNPSAKSGMPGNPVTITASLTDISQHPAVAVVGQMVTLKLGNDSCMGSTDVNGLAHCTIGAPTIIPGSPNRPLTASFAGTGSLVASAASATFLFTAPPESAKLNVTPKTRGFPTQVELGGVGAVSKPALVTVVNPKSKKQNLTVTFLGAENSGDFAIVTGGPTTCGATLAAKTKCTIGLTFSPTGAGVRTGTLMVADNANLNSAQMVNLKGTGKQGKIKFAPGSLNFAKQGVNSTSPPKMVNISNANPVPMAFAASVAGDYAISSNNCGSTIAANASCAIGVTFKPTMTGSRPGTLTFTDTALKSPQTVKLSGSGQ